MTAQADQIAIENRFGTLFTAVQVKYANVDTFVPDDDETWCELFITIADSRRASIGDDDKLHRTTGVISVNVYVPKGTGTVNGKAIADTAAAIFRDAQFSGITCRSPAITDIGEVENWYVINMTVPFQRDELF